jgi:D-3-phosphoglycerate dehydrogenase
MKALVIGDLFITDSVLMSALDQRFEGSDISFEYDCITFDWPVVPVQKNDEIREFVGDASKVVPMASDAEVIVTHSGPVPKSVIDAAPGLKVVGAARGGPVNINWAACTEREIPVLYAPGRNSGAVAEFTIGLMLAESRKITLSHMSMMNDRRWRGDLYQHTEVGLELNSAVVGLIGFGAIGKKVARILHGFGSKILVYDPFVDASDITAAGCEPVDLETLLKESDFISLHARLNEETKGMIGAREIGIMKPTAYVVNTARGELIDHAPLYQAITDGKLAGAALDIVEAEPPPDDSPLFTTPNITVSSHLGGASIQAAEIGASVLAGGMYEFLLGTGKPPFCVNPEVFQ